jgi:hypothetical protein
VLITARRICWPNPDATCLTGACVRCRTGPWKRLTKLRRYARRKGEVPTRHRVGERESALGALEYGLANRFFHTPVRGRLAKPEHGRGGGID